LLIVTLSAAYYSVGLLHIYWLLINRHTAATGFFSLLSFVILVSIFLIFTL